MPSGHRSPVRSRRSQWRSHPEVAKALEPMAAAMADAAPPPVGDVDSRRPVLDAVMAQTAAAQTVPTDVRTTDFRATGADGAQVLLRGYVKEVPPADRRSCIYTVAG